jgi:hypothetical protein
MKPAYFENLNIHELKAYAESTVITAFNNVAVTLEEEYNYPQGGCQQRAHMSSLLLDKEHKIEHAKIWLFAAGTLTASNNTMLEIKDINEFTPGNIIQWGYHVAPVVKIKKNNKIMLYVIDPALDKNKPITVDAWFGAITNSGSGSFTYTTSETYFFNCYFMNEGGLSTVFDGTFYGYDKEDQQNLVLEKGIAICSTAMYIFRNHIQDSQAAKKNKKSLDDLKDIFGNATAIDYVIAQNASANTPNTVARYVITHYPAILNEAKTFFNERLVHWVNLTNQLLKK